MGFGMRSDNPISFVDSDFRSPNGYLQRRGTGSKAFMPGLAATVLVLTAVWGAASSPLAAQPATRPKPVLHPAVFGFKIPPAAPQGADGVR
ncbi:MAG: hypothetical protein RIS70_1267, partial [Planctomycetota bacterium]